MSCQYSLVFLFLFGFTIALTVAEICKTDLLEGTSCTFELKTKNTDKSNEIKWIHLSSDALIQWKNGKIKKSTPGLTMEEDGSLKFESVSLKNTGKYKYNVYNSDGTEIDAGEKEITVYAKAPIPTLTVNINCTDGISTLTCDFTDRPDLTVSWYKEENIIQNKNNPKLLLTSAHIQENKPYSCSVRNPVSNEQSNSVTVSCPTGEGDPGPTGKGDPGPTVESGSGPTVESGPGPRTFFGFDFWVMVGILAGSGALLLLLLCVLIICVCRSCSQHKHQKDEGEFRLRNLQAPAPTKTDPNTEETSDYD